MPFGFVFWNIGSGIESFNSVPQSITLVHREHFAGYRQEEIYTYYKNVYSAVKFGYVQDMELRDESGNLKGTYSASFFGMSGTYMTHPPGSKGWTFGIGPGFSFSRVHSWVDWALTANFLALGSFDRAKLLFRVENLGIGSLIPISETFAGGYLILPQDLRLGGFLRFFSDVDTDFGLYVSKSVSILDMEFSSSYRYLTFGLLLRLHPVRFTYRYTHSYYGLGSHALGVNFALGR